MSGVATSATDTFERARRRSAYRRLARVVRGESPPDLLPLEEATKRLRPFGRRYVGVRPIPLKQVVGTDSRGGDFDRDFLPRRPDIGARWRQVERAHPDGAFPPIVVYQLGDAYFVLDGHHRVAIARQRGMETIDAEVTELQARWHLRPDADIVELIHAEQQRIFMEESGLDRTRPELCIDFSRPVGYIELLETVQLHGYHAMLAAGRALDPAEISADWLEQVYEPTVAAIRHEGLDRAYPEATEADLFLFVWERRRELMPDIGCQPLEQATQRMAAEGRKRPRVGKRLASAAKP
jgi:ParB/Sulfiredoxin domain